jgi:hypothetical protein
MTDIKPRHLKPGDVLYDGATNNAKQERGHHKTTTTNDEGQATGTGAGDSRAMRNRAQETLSTSPGS